MGVLWLQTTDGKLIHVPIVGADINTPDSPTKVPTSIFSTAANRCLNGQYNVDMSAYGLGTVTVNLGPPGRTGTCNQCGECCSHPIASCPDPGGNCGYVLSGAYHKCQYLTIQARGIGKSNGTECSIRATLLDRFKGCVLFPESASDIANCPACGFTFGG